MIYGILPLIVAIASSAAAQEFRLPPPLELRYGNHRIAISQRGEKAAHSWYDEVCRGWIERTTVDAICCRGDMLYIVFGCAGWSRGQLQSQGRCGSDWEHHINWMAIRDGVIVGDHHSDITSCWRDVYGSIAGWKHGVLVWSPDGIDTGYFSLYDPQSPEKGLQLKDTHKLPIP